ncbi:MAG: HEAT repeat domain-containing protein [Phycisphaeraceae bacterium]|nr:HEAT repeat domain-containing protein [Phycisphaeraceae bacterium]
MNYSAIVGATLALLCGASAWGQDGFYFSVGDNQTLGRYMSLDSAEVIGATFDMLQDVYGVERIYWRGLQMQQISDSLLRPEAAQAALRYEWQNTILDQQMQINHIAVQLAHDRGMEIWGEAALYDWGAGGTDTVGSLVGWPAPIESYLRVNNPQWVPVDRYGVLMQGGPVELAYPDARTALADWLHQTATDTGYDGVMFHTFAENLSTHFQDQYGFSDPIVAEFQSRYGVDIRRESFNIQDWRDLRGEYTTQFLTTLRDQLAPDNIKLGVELNGINSTQPMHWGSSPFPTAGSMTMDWQDWVDGELVDELQFRQNFSNGTDVSAIIAYTNGTPVQISSVHQNPYGSHLNTYKNQGVSIIGAALTEEEFMRNSQIPIQPISALIDPDPYKRMRVLGQIIDGNTAATVAQVSPLLNDANILVRRMAIKALGTIGDSSAIPLLENAMFDASNTIRTAAVYALRNYNDPGTPQKILDAMAQNGNPTFLEEAKNTLVTYGATPAIELLLTNALRLHDPSVDVRRLAIRTLWNLPGPQTLRMRNTIIVALNDPDPFVRFWAAAHHVNIAPDDNTLTALINAAQSSDTIVAIRAADSIGKLIVSGFPVAQARRQELIDTLVGEFGQYGNASVGSDTAWGYEPVGRALQGTGTEGQALLRQFMIQRTDRVLSENAWRILYYPNDPVAYSIMTEQQAQYAYLRRPHWDTVQAMADSFEDAPVGQMVTQHSPDAGTLWQVVYGDPSDQTIVSREGQKVLELRRRQGTGTHLVRLTGHLYDASVAELTRVTVKADWLREDDETFGRMVLDLGHTGATRNPSIIMHTNGNYWVLTGDSAIDTGVPIGEDGWETIEMVLTWGVADGDAVEGTYDVYLSRDAGNSLGALARQLIADDIAVATTNVTTLQQLDLLNDAKLTGDTVTFWDNILVKIASAFFPGDANSDGMVNLSDLQILGDNWQSTTATWAEADFTGDGMVDLSDLQILGDNWGYDGASDIAFAYALAALGDNVPEPAVTTVILMMLTLQMLRQRRPRANS